MVLSSVQRSDPVLAVMSSALGRHYIDTATEAELQGRAKRVYIPLQGCRGCCTFVVATEAEDITARESPRAERITIALAKCREAITFIAFVLLTCAFRCIEYDVLTF